jgi:hypothetical protein
MDIVHAQFTEDILPVSVDGMETGEALGSDLLS